MFRCICLIIVSFICLIVYETTSPLYPSYHTYNYVPFEARIVQSYISNKNNLYEPKILYQYTLENRKYTSQHIYLKQSPLFKSYWEANAYLLNYTQGKTTPIYFNYDNFGEAVLERGFNLWEYTKLITLLPFIFIGGLFISLTFYDQWTFKKEQRQLSGLSFMFLLGSLITTIGSYVIFKIFHSYLEQYQMIAFLSFYIAFVFIVVIFKKTQHATYIQHPYKRQFNTTMINSLDEKPMMEFLFYLKQKIFLPLFASYSLLISASIYFMIKNHFTVTHEMIWIWGISVCISLIYILFLFKKEYRFAGNTTSLN